MKLNSSGGDFIPCPEYEGPAVCVDVTPLRTVPGKDGPWEFFQFVFEVDLVKDAGTGEKWCVWSPRFTPKTGKKAKVVAFLANWFGHEPSKQELEMDLEELVGRTAKLVVVQSQTGDTVYANIGLIRPDKSAAPLTPSGKFVRAKDRPPRDGEEAAGGGETSGSGWRRAAQPVAADTGDQGATKVHVGKCKGIEVRDLAPEQVKLLIEKWLPGAQANAKPTADDRRLIAALEWWQGQQADTQDDVPY